MEVYKTYTMMLTTYTMTYKYSRAFVITKAVVNVLLTYVTNLLYSTKALSSCPSV